MANQSTLCARHESGSTPEMQDWYLKSETGPLHDVLLGPSESFAWLGEENAEWSSLVRESLRKGRVFDADLAKRQHAEMVAAYEDAGTKCHFLPTDHATPYQAYARDSSFMTPYGAVLCQLANPRRRGEYAAGVALVGYTDQRSEKVAAEQVANWFIKEGWEIKFAPIDPFYVHIDLMVCMLTKDCAAVCLETTEDDVVDWLRKQQIEQKCALLALPSMTLI